MNKIILYILLFFTLLCCTYAQDSEQMLFDANQLSPNDSELVLIDGVFAVVGNHVIFHSDINNLIMQYQTQGFNTPNLRNQVIEELFLQKT